MPKEINIILDKSTHAQPFEANSNLIHQDELENVLGFIKKKIENVNRNIDRKNKPELHLHDTITILGSRGSGKTSFLLSVQKELEKKNKFGDINSSDFQQVQVLEIIDPTLIEEKGHVFLNVISRITELVENKLDDEECKPTSDQIVWKRKDWRNALSKLASGLPSIDGVADHINNSWQDPEFVMENGLKSVGASFKLSENFHNLLVRALEILDKKVFLLMFDDIDVDSRKGWPVLETIRKYLTSERLITLLSGDLKLYSTVVRQKKWQNFGSEILKYEGEVLKRLGRFDDTISELESQYLQKILQPRLRIALPTLWQLINERDSGRKLLFSISHSQSQLESKIEIQTAYKNFLKIFGIISENETSQYLRFFLNTPLRTQIQILSIFYGDILKQQNAGKYAKLLIDVFFSDLQSREIDPIPLRQIGKMLNRFILQFLIKERKLVELYQLQPFTTDSFLNAGLLTLNFMLVAENKYNPFVFFDYFIRIGYLRNLMPLIGYKDDNSSDYSLSFVELCRREVILNDGSLKSVTGRIISYLRGYLDKGSNSEYISKAGSIPLFGLASTAKKGIEDTADRIDGILKIKSANRIERLLVYLPLTSNQYAYKQSSLLTYSPYTLLGAIGELCKKIDSEISLNDFFELAQLRAFIMPDFKRRPNEEYETPEEISLDFADEGEDVIKLEEYFKKWVKARPEELTVSSYLMGKISTRFFYALANLENKIGRKNLGEIFQAQLIAFMNAVLIEDCIANSDFSNELNLNNPRYSEALFVNNLKKVIKKAKSNSEVLSFSKWMLACPILWLYLKRDNAEKANNNVVKAENNLLENLIEFCGINDEDLKSKIGKVFEILKDIPIKSEKTNNLKDEDKLKSTRGRRSKDSNIESKDGDTLGKSEKN
ncbi:hypothetical protein [Emticicia fluvialis]|uniref:hypothetical protein n=1 Tax=Emticicia fluvialis TaxID=2974474 RepID=UPI00216699D9|nr:hypothetical protein [Emticicia fluvialis]